MVTAKELSIGVVTMIFAGGSTFGQVVPQPPGAVTGKPPSLLGSEKPELIRTLGEIQERARSMRDASGNSNLSSVTEGIIRSARWFSDVAARWTPKKRHEGEPLLAAMGRMLQVLRAAPATGPELAALLNDIREDLSVKEDHCRAKGLASPQRVSVITKKNALEEVKGLEVLYIEKFFQSDANARPQQFRRFSSPALDDLVPGRYVFWAKEPGESGRPGERKEARIGNGLPKELIEVLAP